MVILFSALFPAASAIWLPDGTSAAIPVRSGVLGGTDDDAACCCCRCSLCWASAAAVSALASAAFRSSRSVLYLSALLEKDISLG